MGPVVGAAKSSASTSVHVPVVRLVASRLYWKSMRSALFRVPRRHCSPVYEIASVVTVLPVSLVNAAPIVGFRLPL